MQRTIINGTELAYTVQGNGEPVVLFHCGFVADSCLPLMGEAALGGYQLINYHRRGYGESANSEGVVPFEQQAADCLALMDHLGVEKAHVAGHSLGGCVALQVALSAPERVASLIMLEPSLVFAASPASQALFGQVVGASYARYGGGDVDGAVDTWLSVPFGPGYRAIMECNLPGSTKGMARAAIAVFESETPALQMWQVGPDSLQRITQPILSVYHTDPNLAFFEEGHQTLVTLQPRTESYCVPNVTHMLQLQDAPAVAKGIAGFLARHRIS
jgi:pimeloyl-ACP methyl ester carboxylesterase